MTPKTRTVEGKNWTLGVCLVVKNDTKKLNTIRERSHVQNAQKRSF